MALTIMWELLAPTPRGRGSCMTSELSLEEACLRSSSASFSFMGVFAASADAELPVPVPDESLSLRWMSSDPVPFGSNLVQTSRYLGIMLSIR